MEGNGCHGNVNHNAMHNKSEASQSEETIYRNAVKQHFSSSSDEGLIDTSDEILDNIDALLISGREGTRGAAEAEVAQVTPTGQSQGYEPL